MSNDIPERFAAAGEAFRQAQDTLRQANAAVDAAHKARRIYRGNGDAVITARAARERAARALDVAQRDYVKALESAPID